MELNIFSLLIVAFMCIVGMGSTICIVGYLIATVARKIYRKMRFGISLYE